MKKCNQQSSHVRQKHCNSSCLVSVANFECLNTLLNSRRHKISKYTWNPFHLSQNSLSRFHSQKILRIRLIDHSLCSLRVTNHNISVSYSTNPSPKDPGQCKNCIKVPFIPIARDPFQITISNTPSQNPILDVR